jgi:YVTN family beta-propeller protein
MYVTNTQANTVSVINQSNVVIKNISVQSEPEGVVFDPYNNYMYVTNTQANTVSVINHSNVVIKNISVQSCSKGIAFDPYNDYMYVTSPPSGTVSVINQSDVVIKIISVQSGPFGIAFDPYNNYMYVTHEASCTVSVINQSNVVINNIYVQHNPIGIAFDPYNNYMYVSNFDSSSVSVINQSNVVIKNISVQSEPEEIAFDSYNDYMYVTNHGSGTVSILSSTHDISFYTVQFNENGLPKGTTWDIAVSGIHYSSNTNIISIALTPAKYTFTAATPAKGMSWDNAFNTFTVNNSSTNVSVYFTQNQYIGNTTVQSDPRGIAFDPYNDYMYVANSGNKTVSVIDQSNAVIKNISVQCEPYGIAFDPYNDYMYVINCGSNSVSVINQSNVVIKNISVQAYPKGIAFDPYNDYMYVTNLGPNTVSVINQSNVVIKNISVQSAPIGIAFDPYNDYMYVTNLGPNTVSVIDQSNVVIKNISVKTEPHGIAFDPYNDYMYVTNLGANTVSVIDQSNVVIKNVSVQSNPRGIAFDPYNDYMYVTNYGSGTVSILSSAHDILFYAVEFVENDLPTGTTWNITLSGTHYSSDGNIISVQLTPAEYTYTAMSSNSSFFPVTGTFNLSNNMIVNIQFQEKKYQTTFKESGLPPGTTWYVNISGMASSGPINTTSYTVNLANGEYDYMIATSDKIYEPSPSSGSLNVNGTQVSEHIEFSELKYQVTFTESGLPPGTTWYVNISGMASSGPINTTSYTVNLANGTHNYMIATSDKIYEPSPTSSSMDIVGKSLYLSITFNELTYNVIFTETGLPSDTTWYLNLSTGQSFQSTTNTISFMEPNGTYYYTISSTEGRTYSSLPSSSKFTISGSSYSWSVIFSEVKYQVTFKETGLPSGTTWYIAVDNSSLYESSQSNNVIDLPNGTYHITAISTGYSSNFTGNQTHLILTVSGFSMTVSLNFSKISSVVKSTPSSSNDLLIAIGTAAGVIAGVAAGFLVFRRKN